MCNARNVMFFVSSVHCSTKFQMSFAKHVSHAVPLYRHSFVLAARTRRSAFTGAGVNALVA